MLRRIFLLSCLVSVAQASNLGPAIELDCPCTFSTDSITSANIEAGITNIGDSATGQLVIRVWSHTDPNLNDSTDNARLLIQFPVTDSLAASSAIAKTTFKTGLVQPNDGTFYLTFRLLEDGAAVDAWRMKEQVTLESAGGGGGDGSVYFDAPPTHSIDGDTLTLNIPVIVNNSADTNHNIQVDFLATQSSSFFGVSAQLIASQSFNDALAAGTQTTAVSPTFDFTSPSSGFDYYHVSVKDTDSNLTLVYQTIRVPDDEILFTRSFSATTRDYLLDTDGDGVGDINEELAQTDPDSAGSVPGSSMVDVLALYSPGVTTLYDGDPSTRIDHLMTVSNQVLSDSGVDMQLRLVDSQEYAMDESQNIDQWIDAADSRDGVFANLNELRDSVGADLIVFYRPFDSGDTCGIAQVGGFLTRGDFSASTNDTNAHTPVFIDADSCEDHTTIHEFGHLMGLGHSFVQNETGTFDWSRGHGVTDSFTTVMGYSSAFNGPELLVFSSPDLVQCDGGPCGIDVDMAEAAHAVKSLNTVRIQVANFRSTVVGDTDGDGVLDTQDDLPNDPTETVDTDMDGTGNNADADDDNDGMPDTFEVANGLDSLVDDASLDTDGDGATNLQEFETDTDPNDPLSIEACLNPLDVATLPTDSSFTEQQLLYFANPGTNTNQQTFLRFVNNNDSATDVEVYGIDDGGSRSNKGPITFTIAAEGAKQINAQDVENGNDNKNIASNLCDGQGKWQLVVRSSNPIEVMGLIRTPDGFLTSLNDVVPEAGGNNLIYFANPASNTNQQTFIRIVNLTGNTDTVTITGIDDTGASSTGTVSFTLGPNESKQMTAQDLENGNTNKGLTGSLEDGAGKWRLTVASSLDLKVMSLIRTKDGFLTNLSGMVDEADNGDHVIFFANPASDTDRQTFLRIINTGDDSGMVTISAVDDTGSIAPGGVVTFTLEAQASKQMIAADLENGNENKGLTGAIGSGSGRWRLTVSSDLDLQVMSLVRTPDGFLTNLSRTVPVAAGVNDVFIFNPASNENQRSSLRLVNNTSQQGSVTINGFDDSGAEGGEVTFNIPADNGMLLTAQDLENGTSDLMGSLGDGMGKWRLVITSDVDLQVQSLLDTPTGFLTNLSRTTE